MNYDMIYPYTTDLFFGSEKASSDGHEPSGTLIMPVNSTITAIIVKVEE